MVMVQHPSSIVVVHPHIQSTSSISLKSGRPILIAFHVKYHQAGGRAA